MFNYPKTLSESFTRLVQCWVEQAIQGVLFEDLPYVRTYYGIKFRHLLPRPEDICIEDIAHSLSRICRFTGHVIPPLYSVAEHCVRVSYACDGKDALDGLLHDASEAYCTDIARPFKRSPGMEAYRWYEKRVMKPIVKKFNLASVEPDSVQLADRALLATEQRDIMPLRIAETGGNGPMSTDALPDKIVAWTQEEAERRFLMRFYELTGVSRFYEKQEVKETEAVSA